MKFFNPRRNSPTRTMRFSNVVRISLETERTLTNRRINFDLVQVQKSLAALRRDGLINDGK